MWPALRLAYKGLRQKALLGRGLEHIRQIQQQRLCSLVARARSESPFYRERLQQIDPQNFRLEQLPTVTKQEMMENFDRFLTVRDVRQDELEEFVSDPNRLGQWFRGRYAVSRTSGTQGQKALIVQDREVMEQFFALQMIRGTVFPTTPLGLAEKIMSRARLAVVTIGRGFYPSAVALAYAPECARTFVDRLWLTHVEPMDEVVDRLNAHRPQVLLAYANVLELLAREALGGRLRLPELRQIINVSEPLSNGARHLLREAFGLSATDTYACGECLFLSIGCPDGHGMHLQADWALLEVVDAQNRPVPAGQPGAKVLLTNLMNGVQPFIRYELNDVVTMSPEPCPCGNPLPLIRKVEGRTDEAVWIRDGDRYRQLHPYVFVDFLDEDPALGWYQITQVERNRFLLRGAPAPGREINPDGLRSVVRQGLLRFGLTRLIKVDVEIDNRVAPDPHNGKLKRIISRVGPPDSSAAPRAEGIPSSGATPVLAG